VPGGVNPSRGAVARASAGPRVRAGQQPFSTGLGFACEVSPRLLRPAWPHGVQCVCGTTGCHSLRDIRNILACLFVIPTGGASSLPGLCFQSRSGPQARLRLQVAFHSQNGTRR